MNADVWVLGDYRKGNTNQAIALAEEIGLDFELKIMKYNLLGRLPNFLLNLKPLHINQKFLQSLVNLPLPKLIISSGRRTAPVALYLKQKFDNNLKIIQIMKPGAASELFDLLVLPQHDSFKLISSNVIRTIGAITNVKAKLPLGSEEFKKNYPEVKKFIGVMIGGDNKSYKYSKGEIISFIQNLSNIAKDYIGMFFISFSRRTPPLMKQLIRQEFLWPHIIYDPEEKRPNPYFGILSNADSIITTADSISMSSEVASTGKPLYIFCPADFNLKKHKFFIQQLFDLGVAKSFNDSLTYLPNYSYTPLNEVTKVADYARSELLDIKV